MAFDLDDDELKATREMYKNVESEYDKKYRQAIIEVAKYFPLSSEEVEAILNGEVSYKTMYEIAFSQSATEFKDSVYAFRFAVMQQQIDEKDKKKQELKEENAKLKQHSKELIKEKQQLTTALLDSIPRQKVKDKIEDLRYNSKLGFEESFKIEALEELLE